MFEAGQEYKTRDGRRARVYAMDAGGSYPILGAFEEVDAHGAVWWPFHWTESGMAPSSKQTHGKDLISSRALDAAALDQRALDAAVRAVEMILGHGRDFAISCAETAILTYQANAK